MILIMRITSYDAELAVLRLIPKHIYMCVFVCVCVCEWKRHRDRDRLEVEHREFTLSYIPSLLAWFVCLLL